MVNQGDKVYCRFSTRGGQQLAVTHVYVSQWPMSTQQIESVARANTKQFDSVIYIPAYGYQNDPTLFEQGAHGMPVLYNDDSEPADYGPENQALWCEIKKHSFSAKDPDKVLLRVRGESKLACGECATSFFGSEPKPKELDGGS